MHPCQTRLGMPNALMITIYLLPEPTCPYPENIKEAHMAKKKAAKKVKPAKK